MRRTVGRRVVYNDDNNPIAIKVVNLHKDFRLPTEKAWGLKQAFFNFTNTTFLFV